MSLLVLLLLPAPARSQAVTGGGGTSGRGMLRLFLDCTTTWCDAEYVRSEVNFVDHVRDRRDADVHVMVTAQSTGSGGRQYTVAFIGLGRFVKVDHALTYAVGNADSGDVVRRGLVRTLKLGLVRYAADTPAGPDLQVTFKPAAAPAGSSRKTRDPWNFWVFRTSLRGSGSGESSRTSGSFSGSFSANRVTEAWKVTSSLNGSYSQSRYTFTEGDDFTSISRNFSASGMVARSLGPRWAAGGRASISSSTYLNQRAAIRVAPALEWNLFPYKESTRRQLTFNYALGLNRFDYREETIFGRLTEGQVDHTLQVSLGLKQPWGSTSTSFEVSQYLKTPAKHRLVLDNELDVRLFKGFSVTMWGSVSRVRDQLYLPKGEATTEEILVRQRQMATSYQYYVSIGVSYSFGSIFNNVVNTRFNGGGMAYYY